MPVTKTMAVDELRQLVAPYETMKHIVVDAKAGGLHFKVNDGKVRFECAGQEYGINQDAYFTLGQIIGVPTSFNKKVMPNRMVPIYNDFLTMGDVPKLGFAAQDGTACWFSKGSTEPISNTRILDRIEAQVGPEIEVFHVSNDPFRTIFSVVTQQAAEPKVGDVVRMGITVENSYTKKIPTAISTYIHTLRCTNGMVSADTIFKRSRKASPETMDDWIDAAISQALGAGPLHVERLRQLQAVRLDDHTSKTLEGIFAEYGIPPSLRDRMTARVMDNPPDDLYDLVQVITDLASNDEEIAENPRLSNRLMRIGAAVARHPELCNSCHRPIA